MLVDRMAELGNLCTRHGACSFVTHWQTTTFEPASLLFVLFYAFPMRLATRVLTLFLAGLALLPAAAATYGAHVGASTPAPGLTLAKPATPTFTPPSLHAALTSMPSQSGAPSLSVFPNPARGLLTVQLLAQHGPEYKLRLSNVLGREVRLLPLPLSTATTGLPLDVTGLPAGLYFCSLLVNDKAVSTNRLTLL
jgi:hypothetical protein